AATRADSPTALANARSSVVRAVRSSAGPSSGCGIAALFRELERGVTDDATAVARGVARIAQVEQRGAEPAHARHAEQPVDRRGPARLLVIERRLAGENLLGGRAIAQARIGVGM